MRIDKYNDLCVPLYLNSIPEQSFLSVSICFFLNRLPKLAWFLQPIYQRLLDFQIKLNCNNI